MTELENIEVKKIKSGDREAFDNIARKYSPLIDSMYQRYYLISLKYGYMIDEDDFKQEAAIALYNAAMTFENKKNVHDKEITFGLYAKICIRNNLISLLRKNKNKLQSEYIPETEILEGFAVFNPKDIELNPEEQLIERESYELLIGQINRILTDYEKSVFELYVDDNGKGKTYKEIAVLLGRSEKSVDNAIYRIKAKLKKGI